MSSALLASRGTTKRAFRPSDVANLAIWFKGSTPSLANDAPVATWADSSGNAVDATQATEALRPLYKTSASGHPGLFFDGSNDRLALTGPALSAGAWTVFVVAQPIPSSDDYGVLLTATAGNGVYYRGGSRILEAYPGATSDTAITESATHVFAIWGKAAAIDFQVDGAADGSDAVTFAFTPTLIGDDTSSETFKGYVFEMVVYSSELSTGNLALVTRYLKSKYAVA